MSVTKVPISEVVKTDGYHTSTICIEFEALFDIPFGIMQVIREKYFDPSVFERCRNRIDNYTLRCLLYEREDYNPIYVAMNQEVKDRDKAQEIYKDMYDDKEVYKEVLDKSPPIAMINTIKLIQSVYTKNPEMIDYIVLCKDRLQQKHIKQYIPDVITRIDNPPYTYRIEDYSLMVLERYENIVRYTMNKGYKGHTIWIPKFYYNMELSDREIPSLEVSSLIADLNIVQTYEPYNNFTKPLG